MNKDLIKLAEDGSIDVLGNEEQLEKLLKEGEEEPPAPVDQWQKLLDYLKILLALAMGRPGASIPPEDGSDTILPPGTPPVMPGPASIKAVTQWAFRQWIDKTTGNLKSENISVAVKATGRVPFKTRVRLDSSAFDEENKIWVKSRQYPDGPGTWHGLYDGVKFTYRIVNGIIQFNAEGPFNLHLGERAYRQSGGACILFETPPSDGREHSLEMWVRGGGVDSNHLVYTIKGH